jgi:hypothetical protein
MVGLSVQVHTQIYVSEYVNKNRTNLTRFMEYKASVECSQESATAPYPKPVRALALFLLLLLLALDFCPLWLLRLDLSISSLVDLDFSFR